ncbi:N-acetylmuramoyl-L-alanine amidase [Carboxydocella sp. ULO1]|uniref:N-acetylmuramoyl-L-alanine amidase family protein n=1 Tax=Carboxydocella sp. ULO1 TaxID=1926599 RepID=UPI0009AE6A9B|nr:N-acetylmuramoyl-L-alanine amidase [Carboxydocella sp. ULO1]GAW28160.1 N-acetylmuramoyl-L-alanine amidase [Carboxydocella sp. ULO1]
METKKLQGFAICIDPGHGGRDPGAVDGKNASENDTLLTAEKDVNLSVAKVLADKLRLQGARVTLTRGSDWYPSLAQRCQIANNFGASIFISLHCNAGSAQAAGIETLYNPDSKNGKRLAELVQTELIVATKAPSRGARPRSDLWVLNGTKMPAVLIEMGFVTNPGEEAKLNSNSYQAILADAIVKAILRYKKGESV